MASLPEKLKFILIFAEYFFFKSGRSAKVVQNFVPYLIAFLIFSKYEIFRKYWNRIFHENFKFLSEIWKK